jgi:hypothetical protein
MEKYSYLCRPKMKKTMSWLEELDALLNKSSTEELEQLWSKYNDYDCGPELEAFMSSSMDFFYGKSIDVVTNSCRPGKEEYTNNNDEFALAA